MEGKRLYCYGLTSDLQWINKLMQQSSVAVENSAQPKFYYAICTANG